MIRGHAEEITSCFVAELYENLPFEVLSAFFSRH
jgi:hypothetical protein